MVNVLRRPMRAVGDFFEVREEEELGRGKSGVIYRCQEKTTGRVFACKTIRKELLTKWQHIEEVREEVEILELLRRQPQVPTIRATFEDAEAIHVIMDVCKGGEVLGHIQTHGRYGEREAARICHTVASLLAYCHRKGVMHRDLKPENILIKDPDDPAGVQVIDFGIATYFKGEDLTAVVGTPSYCAPEVLRGAYGAPADIWSCGIILYILLSGIPPFCTQTVAEIQATIEGDFLDLDEGLWLDVAEEARDLIRSMLRGDPGERITAAEIVDHSWIKRHAPILPKPRPPPSAHEDVLIQTRIIMEALKLSSP